MKAYFRKLFEYDFATNEKMINAVKEGGSPDKAVKLLAHLLASQQIWLSRCQGNSNSLSGSLWPDWLIESLPEINRNNNKNWLSFLEAETDFNRVINYKNSKGENYSSILNDVLAHLINHGTHHRAQAGQQLKFNGTETLPVTDYIFYIREKQS